MTAVQLPRAPVSCGADGALMSWWDADDECTAVIASIQFCMATCAQHVLQRWRSSGGVVAPIRSTPYPEGRFRTKMMWWDRFTVARLAAPNQTAKIVAEMESIRRHLHNRSIHACVES